MKTTLIFTLALFFTIISNPIQAQDATNEATWEETIDFIKKKVSYIEKAYLVNNNYAAYGGKLYFSSGKLVCTYGSSRDSKMREMDLEKLESAYGGDGNGLVLNFTGNYIKGTNTQKKDFVEDSGGRRRTYTKTFTQNVETDLITLYIEDDEMQPRLTKAFKHLAYLATEKRKAAREASGEKF